MYMTSTSSLIFTQYGWAVGSYSVLLRNVLRWRVIPQMWKFFLQTLEISSRAIIMPVFEPTCYSLSLTYLQSSTFSKSLRSLTFSNAFLRLRRKRQGTGKHWSKICTAPIIMTPCSHQGHTFYLTDYKITVTREYLFVENSYTFGWHVRTLRYVHPYCILISLTVQYCI
jgi:hypothetical protein